MAFNKKEAIKQFCEENEIKQVSPLKAIRLKCIDCNCGQTSLVDMCDITDCSLWPFRFGKNPYSNRGTKELTDEQRQKLADRMKSARNNIKKNKEIDENE